MNIPDGFLRYRLRRGTPDQWSQSGEVPTLGELALVIVDGSDTLVLGDGVTPALELPPIKGDTMSAAAAPGELYYNRGGTPDGIPFGTSAVGGTVAQRDAAGNLAVNLTPAADTSATARKYVLGLFNSLPVAPRSQTVAVTGDSIDQGGDDSLGPRPYWSGSVWSRLAILSRHQFHLVRNVAVGGQTTAQILARFAQDVISKNPGIVVIGGGRNDLNGGVDMEVTKANFRTLVALAKAAGIVPVLHTVAPVDMAGGGAYNTVDKNRQGTRDLNSWIKTLGTEQGLVVIDLWRIWADSTTGGYKTGYSTDGVHPTGAAQLTAVYSLLVEMPDIFRGRVTLPEINADPTNLFPNALATSDSNNDGIPDVWYFPDFSKITLKDTAYGKLVSIATTGSQQTFYTPGSTANSFKPGDVLAYFGRVVKSAATGASIQLLDAGTFGAIASPIANMTDQQDGVFYIEYTVESSVSGVLGAVSAFGTAGSVGVAQIGLRNLTALGLR